MPIGLFILLAIIGLPLLEILVFIEVGSEIGAVPTVLLTIATAVAGSLMLRLQGLSLLRRVRAEMDRGQVPGEDIMQGALIVVASVLLLIPGFLTDALGLLLFVPPLRAAIARIMVRNARVTVVRAGARRKSQGEGVVDLDRDDWADLDDNGKGGPNGSSPWRGEIGDGRNGRS